MIYIILSILSFIATNILFIYYTKTNNKKISILAAIFYILFILFSILSVIMNKKEQTDMKKKQNISSWIDTREVNKGEYERLNEQLNLLNAQISKYQIDLEAAKINDKNCDKVREKSTKTNVDLDFLKNNCTQSDVARIESLIKTLQYEIQYTIQRIDDFINKTKIISVTY